MLAIIYLATYSFYSSPGDTSCLAAYRSPEPDHMTYEILRDRPRDMTDCESSFLF